MEFPIFKTKIEGRSQRFNLAGPKERRDYFDLKAGKEIEKLRDYLKNNTFVAYLLGKKNSGKGTYAKMFAEAVAPDRIIHFSIGDMVREIDNELKDENRKKELSSFLEKNFRGWISVKEIIEILEKRDTKTLLPTELILTFIKRKIAESKKKAIFIDGFPRELDQISYSLFFRDLIGYRDDPDVFVLIDAPEPLLNERIKWRRVCPVCKTSRNLKLLPTSKIGYSKEQKDFYNYPQTNADKYINQGCKPEDFYLICDNPKCQGAIMISKEGDEAGIEPIKERLELDQKLIEQAFSLQGIPKILLRNAIPAKEAEKYVDDYEITPEYNYQWNEKENQVEVKEIPWIFKDNDRNDSYSLLAPPMVVSMIFQINKALGL